MSTKKKSPVTTVTDKVARKIQKAIHPGIEIPGAPSPVPPPVDEPTGPLPPKPDPWVCPYPRRP